MNRRPLDEQETPAEHWKLRLPQNVSAVPSGRALKDFRGNQAKDRRRLRIIAQYLLMAVFFGALGTVAWMAWETETATANRPAETKINFKSNGTLDEAWLRRVIDPKNPPPLFRIKAMLEEEPQVLEAVVRRNSDNSIAITVSERTPVARLQKILDDGTEQSMFVATDGVLYSGINVSRMTFTNLPLIVGTRTTKSDAQTRSYIEGFEPIAKFLTLARERYPAVYREWQKVSLRDYKGRPEAAGALIRVKPRINTQSPDSAALVEIVFSPVEDRFKAELAFFASEGMRARIAASLRAADRVAQPSWVMDMAVWRVVSPRHSIHEPRLYSADTRKQP